MKIFLVGKRASITHWFEDAAAALGAEGHNVCLGVVRHPWLNAGLEAALAEPLAAAMAALAMDVSEVLTRFDYAPSRPAPGLTIAYHAACSLQHGQGITAQPKALLKRAGFTVREAAESHICCGSAGTYNLLQPEIAAQLRARKLANIGRLGADLIAAGNIGCLTQLGGEALPTAHTVELLDWMAGGPEPAGVTAAQARRRESLPA